MTRLLLTICAVSTILAAACGGRETAPYCMDHWHLCAADTAFCCRDGWTCGTGGNGCAEYHCCEGAGP